MTIITITFFRWYTHTHKVCVFDWNGNFFTIITYHYGNSTLKSHYQTTTTTTVDNRLIIVMQNDYLSSSLLLSCEYCRILSDFQMLKFESNKQTNKLAVNNSTEWMNGHTQHTHWERENNNKRFKLWWFIIFTPIIFSRSNCWLQWMIYSSNLSICC